MGGGRRGNVGKEIVFTELALERLTCSTLLLLLLQSVIYVFIHSPTEEILAITLSCVWKRAYEMQIETYK